MTSEQRDLFPCGPGSGATMGTATIGRPTPWRITGSLAAWLGLASGGLWAGVPPLPALGADLSQTSVSGISSGGFMAAQLATAYSGSIMGVGIVAGGPFYCAGSIPGVSYLQNAMTTCMVPLGPSNAPDAQLSWAKARQLAQAGLIDDVANLERQRVYLFSGASDETVKTIVVDRVAQYYGLAGTPQGRIKYVKHSAAGHSIVTDDAGHLACHVTAPPFINNCGFAQSQDILRHIYGPLNPPASAARLGGRLIKLNQKAFAAGSRTGMSDEAFAYIPRVCESTPCKVHVAIHGCLQYAGKVGSKYYSDTGYNEIADTNGIIVLYPQTVSSMRNPMGCWDFWGYSSPDPGRPQDAAGFYVKSAPQMAAIMGMVKRLGEPRPPGN